MSHLSLFELNALIKTTLEESLETTYWVVAEISELRLNPKGHCYMELVEKEGNFISAKMRANIWSYTYRSISGGFQSVTGSPLKSGIKVLFNISIQFHEVYGLSLNVKDIDPNYTLGERAKRRQEVIDQLKADGVFDLNKSIELPLIPQRIAIISSESAAGYGDFMNQLENNSRGFSFETQLFQSLMQGDAASSSIIDALGLIQQQSEKFDLIVIIRGGGAQTDLDCFDDYELASRMAQFTIPVITGIGHERDETIADMVAHTKMKTPTAVADFLVSGFEAFDDSIDEYFYRIYQKVSSDVTNRNHELRHVSSQLSFSATSKIREFGGTIEGLSSRFIIRNDVALASNNTIIEGLKNKLGVKIREYLSEQNQRLSNFEKEFKLVEPNSVLRRGYTISRVNGKLIRNSQFKEGDELITQHEHGEIKSTITSTE